MSEASVYLNGRYIKEAKNPEKLAHKIRKMRRKGQLSPQTNVVYYEDSEEVRVENEAGRTRRPLIVVENGKPKLTQKHIQKLKSGQLEFSELVEKGVVEYLDAAEEENAYIALNREEVTKEHTHMEVYPLSIFGLPASLIPYAEYNRGDRINYGAKMSGQAIGMFSTNYPIRTDTKSNILTYPQSPLVNTESGDVLEKYPGGQNVVIAVMCHEGFNMNDALVMNKSSVERGLFRSFYFRAYETEKRKYFGGQEDEITIPGLGVKGHRGEEAYKHLDEDGIINPETQVQGDSVLIGKMSPLRFLFGEEFAAEIESKRETSVTVRHGEDGIVDDVLITETPDGNQLVKVRVRDERVPEIGDKFASRFGQKGVISLLVEQENLPFTSDGVVPDVIFNPHAIPSRMTVGQLMEMLAAKLGVYKGQKVDGSAFRHQSAEDMKEEMEKLGFRFDGKQALYDGKSGKVYQSLIFTGICHYYKLDHMVKDKVHARAKGPVTLLTKQPTEGRAKRGGLRMGEMEQQCLLGHGAAMTLKERFSSDKTTIPVCEKCGLLAINDVAKNRTYCPVCKKSEIFWVETSYAFKLLLDELKSTGMYPKIEPEEI